MEGIIQFIFAHADSAHWIIFLTLLLTGFSIPISEDVLIILSAILASKVIPEHFFSLFLAVFWGCYFSDLIAYWIGRKAGQKLGRFKWFYQSSSKRKEMIQSFYQRYGFCSLLIGRLIPFGVRNCLFLAAGMGNMPFKKFLIQDGIACLLSNTFLFYLTYALGKNYQIIYSHLRTWNLFIGLGALLFVGVLVFFIWYSKRRKEIKRES